MDYKKMVMNPIMSFLREGLIECLQKFKTSGNLFGTADRNVIKLFEVGVQTINIKSFKIPNFINKIAYKYVRKSKAKRSYEYATILLEKGIGTPQPIAYYENFSWFGLQKSYYVSEHLITELTYRELVLDPDYPDYHNILKQFTAFTFKLHEKGIEFLDHSPGNTLIKKEADGNYSFFLVDLNRMNFHDRMNFDQRMKNFSRLTPKEEMIAAMSTEYSKLAEIDYEQVYRKMLYYTKDFQERFQKKRARKERFLFWR